MKLSIIVPIYNSSKYLKKCLDSIQNQTFKDFEVLLVNDGSTDDSAKICKKYVENDSKFKYFYKQNGGLSDARNFGLEKAIGKWIGFVDSDDSIDPNMYAWLMERESFGCDIICCLTQRIEENEPPHNVIKNDEFIVYSPSDAMAEYLDGKITMDVYTKIYNREIFVNVRFPVGHHMEDAFVIPYLFHNSTQIGLLKLPLYHYYYHPNSITTRPLSEDVFNIYWIIEKYRKEFPALYPNLKKNVEKFAFHECVVIYRTTLLQKKMISNMVYKRARKEFNRVFWKGLFKSYNSFKDKIMGLETASRLFLLRKRRK